MCFLFGLDELLEGDFEVVDEITEEDDANMESSLHTRNACKFKAK